MNAMNRLKALILSTIRMVDPETARRVSRGWGWHLIALVSVVYMALGVNITTNIDNLMLFFGVVSVGGAMGYHMNDTFVTRPTIEDGLNIPFTFYKFGRVLLMCACILAGGSFF